MARYRKFYVLYFLMCGVIFYALGSGLAHFLAIPFDFQKFILGFIWVFSMQLGIVYFDKYQNEKANQDSQQNPLSISRKIFITAFAFTVTASASAMIYQRGKVTPALTLCMMIMIIGTIIYYYPLNVFKKIAYGELFTAIFLANLIPFFAYAIQAGDYHRLLGMSTFPLTALFLALSIIIRFPDYGQITGDLVPRSPAFTIVTMIGWDNGMKLHNILILCAYLILGLAVVFGFPFSFAFPVFITLPIGLFQIWQLSQIAEGAKPNWPLLIGMGSGLFAACGYLLAYAFWMN
jgi:1,4-dihydroxy-2-naphthoate octaprenyltransferase